MKIEYKDANVRAHCPDCEAITSFESKHKGQSLGTVIVETTHEYNGQRFSRILYMLLRCASCHRGGLAKVHDNGRVVDGVLEEFFPISVEKVLLPDNTANGIIAEYREAMLCAAFGANRAASVLFRSVLEKTLKDNGYSNGSLHNKIDNAAEDGILTESRRRRAHEDIRVLGNDVLHDEWHEIFENEIQNAAQYSQRILEDFYDDRESVEKILIDKGRINKE